MGRIIWWKKKEYPRQKTEKSDDGQITLVTGMFFTLFLAVLLVSQLQIEMFRASSAYLEDALAASGLASALIDAREYGYSHVVWIPDANAAYEKYLVALKGNLGLDENWEGHNKNLISGKVVVENYTVYNVRGETVEVCILKDGREERSSGRLGEVYAPSGQMISHTGVYGEISYPVQGLFGMVVQARKGKLVDIVGAGE